MDNICYGVDMSKEVWQDVPWATDYEASNYGGVRSKPKYVKNGRGMRLKKGKELKVSPAGQVTLMVNGEPNQILKWKVIAQTFINDYKDGLRIQFKDNDKFNCRLDNFITSWHNSIFSNVIINSKQLVEDIPVIAGAFGENKRVLFDITIAKKIGRDIANLRIDTIIPNLQRFKKGVHYLDLKEYSNFTDFVPILLDLGYTENGIRDSEHIFIFSELGVAMLISALHNSNDAKWEFLDKFTRKYFQMEEQIKNQQNTLEQQKKDLLFAIYTGGQAGIIASKQLTELEVQEATAPLIETIEEQAPKVDKFDKYMESDGTYNPTNAAKQLGISSAQKFNSLLKEKKIQYKSGGNYVLYANYQWLKDEGYCKYKEGESNGHPYIQLRWYPKGINWLRDNILDVT